MPADNLLLQRCACKCPGACRQNSSRAGEDLAPGYSVPLAPGRNSAIAKRAATDYNRAAAQGSPGKANNGRWPFQINRRDQWRYGSHSRGASAADLAEFRGGDAPGVEQVG